MNIDKFIEFLKSIERLASNYPSIYAEDKLIPLSLYFWNWDEILDGLEKREEWDIPYNIVPFYSDWHDLFCINTDDGKIISINDDKNIQLQWTDTVSFISSLSSKEIESPISDGVVGVQLDF